MDDLHDLHKQARKEVFNSFFNELVVSIQGDVLYIANACLSRELITSTAHSSIVDSAASLEEKATKLLTAIRNCMVHQKQGQCKFLDILKNRLIFNELVTRIETSVDEIIRHKVAAKCQDGSHALKFEKHSVPRPINTQKEYDLLAISEKAVP